MYFFFSIAVEQTCKSDELFHEIGMVRLQPEVMSCTEWIVFVVLVWDDVLAADVVVWVIGNDVAPTFETIFGRKKSYFLKMTQSQFEPNEKKKGMRFTIGEPRAWRCGYCCFGRSWFRRWIIWRTKSINLIIAIGACFL